MSCMMLCKKCKCGSGLVVLGAGILFLLQDLRIWNFWNINWYTVLFILIGAGTLCARSCPDCQAMMSPTKTKK